MKSRLARIEATEAPGMQRFFPGLIRRADPLLRVGVASGLLLGLFRLSYVTASLLVPRLLMP